CPVPRCTGGLPIAGTGNPSQDPVSWSFQWTIPNQGVVVPELTCANAFVDDVWIDRIVRFNRYDDRTGRACDCFFQVIGPFSIHDMVHFHATEVIDIRTFLYEVDQRAFGYPGTEFQVPLTIKRPGCQELFQLGTQLPGIKIDVFAAVLNVEFQLQFLKDRIAD